jgi:hypothetical protein
MQYEPRLPAVNNGPAMPGQPGLADGREEIVLAGE